MTKQNKVNQESAIQVPCKAFKDEARTQLVGEGYIYNTVDGQFITVNGINGEKLVPAYYYLEPDYEQERLIVRPLRKQ